MDQDNHHISPDQPDYVNSKVPRVIRFAWTVFFVAFIAYLLLYLVPDLKTWIGKLHGG